MANTKDPSWSALVIDDDAGVRNSLRLCLESDGARVLGVGTASGAFEALERSSFDAVFLDLWLGRDSGLEVLPEILRRQPSTGVIVITAFASFETAVQAMKLGAVDYLPKPFTPDQVRHTARRVIEAKLLQSKLSELQERLEETDVDGFFDSESAAYRAFLKQAARAAASEAVIL
jgi:NtrC-family two-component system response regulator AlgB